MAQHTAEFPIPKWEEDFLQERFSISAIDKTMNAALSVMVLGHIEQANRILEALSKYDAFEYNKFQTREFMHYAWNESGIWPIHITQPNEDNLPPASSRMIEQHGGQDGPDLVPHLVGQVRKEWAEMLEKEHPEAEWTNGDFRKARRLAAEHGQYGQAAQAASIEIALALGMDDIAYELIRGEVLSILTESGMSPWETAHGAEQLRAPRLWKLLCSGWLQRELQTADLTQTKNWVDYVIELVDKRFTDGLPRRYGDLGIDELVQLFNSTCLKNRRLGSRGAPATFNLEGVDSDDESTQLPSTFLYPPATENEISHFEAQAKEKGYVEGLPEDYKTFLRCSNGIYPPGHKDYGDNIFRPIDALEFDGSADWAVELLPLESLGYNMDIEFDWPEMDGALLDLGAGGDEGCQWLVTKKLTQEAVKVFQKTYEAAEPHDRTRIERTVRDMYGSMEELLSLEYAVCRMYHWAAELECFGSFKHLLESITEDAVEDKGHGPDDNENDSDDDDDDDDELDNIENEDDTDDQKEESSDVGEDTDEDINEGNGDELDDDAAKTGTTCKKRERAESQISQRESPKKRSARKRTRRLTSQSRTVGA